MKGVFIYTALTLTIMCAAIYSAWQARETLYDSQRPWVFAEAIKFISQYRSRANDGRFAISSGVAIKNYGTSVANEGQAQMRAKPNLSKILDGD